MSKSIENVEEKVNNIDNYKFIKKYKKGEYLKNGKSANGSYIQIKHEYCGSIYDVRTSNFINIGKRCGKCCHKYENSFAYHIEVELGESLEKYWDFDKNRVNPYHIYKNSRNKVWIKCQDKDYHGSYEISCLSFASGSRCNYCNGTDKTHPHDSFGQYLKENNLLHLWSDKNSINPFTIGKSSGKIIWIKCDIKDYHEDYKTNCNSFFEGRRCPYCNPRYKNAKIHPLDSFGQYLKENHMLHLWSNKNTLDPFKISRSSAKRVLMLCDNVDYHNDYGGYEIRCDNFKSGYRCSYCNPKGVNSKVHPLDSFGEKYPDKAKCWHEDNNKSPYEVSCGSDKKYKFRCDICGYVWSKVLNNSSWCPSCSSSKGEKCIEKWLRENDIQYIPQKTCDGLIGVGDGLLSYDFYLPNHNLLIEYQGEQHEKFTPGLHKSYEDFEKQLKHDNRKYNYAKNHNIKLLEIWYYDFDNIETILEKEINSL